MGFKVIKESEESCTIQVTDHGQDGPEFLTAAQRALKNLWLNMTVDVEANPQVLVTILPHLIKLQQVIVNHLGTIVVKGVQGKATPETLSRLKSAGIGLREEALVAPYAMTVPTMSPLNSPVNPMVLPPLEAPVPTLDPYAPPPLPPIGEIEGRFKELRGKLNEALKRRHFLATEKRLYQERMKVLGTGHDDWRLNQEQIQRLHDAEALLSGAKNNRSALQKELDRVTQERLKEEDNLKKVMSEVAADEKKKKEVLDKQLAEINKKHDKIKADFKKKADTRKERLARVQK